MSDPRNVAHAKKVVQQKHHQEIKSRKPKKGKKSNGVGAVSGLTTIAATQPPPPEPKQERSPDEHEKSVAILSKLKDMEFHSKGNIETLAQLTLTRCAVGSSQLLSRPPLSGIIVRQKP